MDGICGHDDDYESGTRDYESIVVCEGSADLRQIVGRLWRFDIYALVVLVDASREVMCTYASFHGSFVVHNIYIYIHIYIYYVYVADTGMIRKRKRSIFQSCP